MKRALAVALVCSACSEGAAIKLDSGVGIDSSNAQKDAAQSDAAETAIDARVIDGPPGAHRHTIVVDGTDDFAANETFATTSTGFTARITWDDQFVYVGYGGPDIVEGAQDSGFKWLFVYVDTDNAATGAATSQTYNTQTATFPNGFGAELYARWKLDASVASIEQFANGGWTTLADLTTARSNDFVELAIPRSAIGNATAIGLVTWMINEKSLSEGSFAGLYANNFTDGYAMTLPLTKYLRIDFASSAPPSDAGNVRP